MNKNLINYSCENLTLYWIIHNINSLLFNSGVANSKKGGPKNFSLLGDGIVQLCRGIGGQSLIRGCESPKELSVKP